jgi:enoyl-CoA hydratase
MPHPNVVAERSSAGYLRLLLSRPGQRNALVPGMVAALTDAMQADSDAVVLLGSTDPRVFCAGADLSLPIAARAAVSDLLYECYQHMITRPGPVIAVVGGPAVGGGAQLAAAADLRIAGPGARLRWAGPAGAGLAVGAWILPDLVGRGAALELGMTGRWVDAAEAFTLGLVHRVEDDPDRAAAGLAETLAAADPMGPGRVKAVAATGGLLDRLRAERSVNRAAFDQALAESTG